MDELNELRDILMDEDGRLRSVITPDMETRLEQLNLLGLLDEGRERSQCDRDALTYVLAQVTATCEAEAVA